ncbi:MAG: CRTAC1 family protein [Bryobacteraceae bacterium]|nr:CRTAC1 family protein [Bryobacteraceae bacterium]
MTRRQLLFAAAAPNPPLGFSYTDVTGKAGLRFRHHSGAFGEKYLPETMGPGCAFLDYDQDGWPDILLLNGNDWPGHAQVGRPTMALYRNNRNGTFADVTRAAGLDFEMYALGVAVGDFDNDGYPDLYITGLGQNRLLRNNRRGGFVDVTKPSGLGNRQSFSTSALWFDYNRDGLLDLFVCNYVRWTPATDVRCSLDGKSKSYCTPEAYRGSTCWLFRNRGDGTFEDVTATSGIFDSTSKALGAAILDDDEDGWPDLLVANDTTPNRLYRNRSNGTFEEIGLRAGVAFSEDGKARAGMGVAVGAFDGSGRPGLAITNFDNEMTALYRRSAGGRYEDVAAATGVAAITRNTLGFGCEFLDADLDGRLDLLIVNGHIDDTVRNVRREASYAQPPHLLWNDGKGKFRDVAPQLGAPFYLPRVGRGLAVADFDRDGDLDLLLTTNGGVPVLLRQDLRNGHRSIRLRLQGKKSNRDGIGAVVKLLDGGETQWRMVHSGSSYLSQSELAVTFGVGRRDRVARVVIQWPSGRVDDHKNLATGRQYLCVEESAIQPDPLS